MNKYFLVVLLSLFMQVAKVVQVKTHLSAAVVRRNKRADFRRDKRPPFCLSMDTGKL